MSQASKPLVVTAGEPAGIGPELCLAIAADMATPNFLLIGDVELLRERAQQLGIGIDVCVLAPDAISHWQPEDGRLAVLDFPFPQRVECGHANADNAGTLLEGLTFAARGCLNSQFSAMVTAPLAKSVIAASGVTFTGHTEFLADVTAAKLPVMLLVAGKLRVALATTHLPLREVPDAISAAGLRKVLDVLHADLRSRFGIKRPDIVVCGLNPHAGEDGLLGCEDAEIIAPLVREFQERGINVRGPLPADTAFTPAAGKPDAILAMYHDQGLPVLKYAGFGNAVNVTLGLPIIRTSVDHGTAFDIAGTGKADTGSLRAAIDLARDIACRL